MSKIGLIIDSAFSITMTEANERGHAFIPMQVIINGEAFKTGVNLTTEELLDKMKSQKKEIELKTSLPMGEDIEAAFDWALERYDKAIYIGVSKHMSGTNNAIKNFINSDDKYRDKIYCYESEYSSPWTQAYFKEIEDLVSKSENFEDIVRVLDLANPYMVGHLSPADIYWFYKGGRLTKVQYMVGSLLKVKPVLTIRDGNLDKQSIEKARGVEKAINKMIDMVELDIERMNGLPFKLIAIDSDDEENTSLMIKMVSERLGIQENEIIFEPVSTEQTAHMGPGAFGLAAYVELKDLIKKEGNN